MCVLSIKVPIRKRSGNIFNDPRIYIYIYIYCHPQTDCFVVRFKLGSKPGRRISYSWAIVIFYVSIGIFCYIFTNTLSATGVLNSWEEVCVYAYAVAGQFLTRVLNPHIYCHPQTVSLYTNPSVSLDTWGASSIYIYIYIRLCLCVIVSLGGVWID